jgi:hypothetical protein
MIGHSVDDASDAYAAIASTTIKERIQTFRDHHIEDRLVRGYLQRSLAHSQFNFEGRVGPSNCGSLEDLAVDLICRPSQG